MNYWYFIYDPFNRAPQLIDFFNHQDNTRAFIPQVEKWYGNQKMRKYIIRDLYPHYILVQSHLNETLFMKKYARFFESIESSAHLVNQGGMHALSENEQRLYEQLLNEENIIRHSVGDIINSELMIAQGPLKGLEAYVYKIFRHQREALLKMECTDWTMRVPLEVVSKS